MAEGLSAYLDNSATTRPTERVIDAMTEAMRGGYYNPSSLYAPALTAEKALDACRDAVRHAIHAPGGRVLFTSGGTEANNLAILGCVRALRGAQHLMHSAVEHPSVTAAYAALAGEGHCVTVLPVDRAGQPDWAALDAAIAAHGPPALVSMMQVNNETGAMPDIARLARTLRGKAPGARIHVDGVQGFARLPFDARDCDLFTLSAHKLGGPKGVGALWARDGVRLAPLTYGGGQQMELRPGTENTPGIAGLHAAITGLPDGAAARMHALKRRLYEGLLAAVPALIVNGPDPDDAAPHILNVSFPPVRGEVMLHALEREHVYVSTGSACSSKKRRISPVLLAMGVPANVAECALRFSICPFTTESEIDHAVAVIGPLYAALSRFRRK